MREFKMTMVTIVAALVVAGVGATAVAPAQAAGPGTSGASTMGRKV